VPRKRLSPTVLRALVLRVVAPMPSGTTPHRAWQQRAACADMDPDLWFPDPTGGK